MNAAQGTTKKGGKALSEYETVAAVRVAVNNGDMTADELLAQLDAIEAETPPEAQAEDVFEQHEEPGADAKPAEKPKEQDAADTEVAVRIKPSWLKAGRSVYRDVESMSKGVAEKDRHIDHLQKDIINPLREELSARETELANLKRELTKRPQAGGEKPAEKPTEQAEEMPDLDNLPELPTLSGDDIYEDDKQTAYHAAVAKRDNTLLQAIRVLQKRLTKEQTPPPVPQTQPEERPSGGSRTRPRNPSADAEWAEVEALRATNPDLFEVETPLRDVEDRYLATVESIAVKAGIQGPVYDELGHWRPEVWRAYQDYASPQTDSAKRLRAACEDAGIRLPQGMEDLNRLYRVRNIRVSTFTADGNPISYADALALARVKAPEAFKRPADVREEAARDIEAEQRVRDKRGQFARETPAHQDSGSEIGEMPIARFMQLMNKKDPTEAEKELLRRAYRSKGIPEDEWPASFKPKG